MKNSIVKLLGFSFLIIFVLAACSKEQFKDELKESETAQSMTVDEVVDMVNNHYLRTIESDADENQAFQTENYGLIDAYTATAEGYDNKSVDNKLLRCLSNVGLDDVQSQQTRRALRAFEQRNERIIQQHRQAYRQLNFRVNNVRQGLIAQLQNGEIDRIEFRRRMNQLRENYQNGLRQIRTSNADAFSRSFRSLMQTLNDMLTERQWAAFTACMRY